MKNLLAVLEAQKELNWKLSKMESLPLDMRSKNRNQYLTQMDVIALITDKAYLKGIAKILNVTLEGGEKK